MRHLLSPPKVMTFSATDPTGGAGLQADDIDTGKYILPPYFNQLQQLQCQDTTGVELRITCRFSTY